MYIFHFTEQGKRFTSKYNGLLFSEEDELDLERKGNKKAIQVDLKG